MKLANGTLILVADGSKALLFRNEGDSINPVLAVLDHREADNPPTSEQGTDAPGRRFASAGARRSALQEADRHQQAEDRFMSEAAAMIENAVAAQKGGIVVVAAPRALGELRKHYGNTVRQRLVAEIDKDLTNVAVDEIAKIVSRDIDT